MLKCSWQLRCVQGLLSMANTGQDMNSSHFSILMAPAPHLDGHYTIFGEVVEGMQVLPRPRLLLLPPPPPPLTW